MKKIHFLCFIPFIFLSVQSSQAQDTTCPPGKEKKRGQCVVSKPKTKKSGQITKNKVLTGAVCAVKVRIEGGAIGAKVSLNKSPGNCGDKKNGKKIVPYNSKTQSFSGADLNFDKLSCECQHELNVELDQYQFDGNPRPVPPRKNSSLKSPDNLFIFTAKKIEPPKPAPPTCDIGAPPFVGLDESPKQYVINQKSNCKNSTYFIEYKFEIKSLEDIVSVNIASDKISLLEVKLFSGEDVIPAEYSEQLTPELVEKRYKVSRNNAYVLRVGKSDAKDFPVTYTLSSSRQISSEGYKAQIDKAVGQLGSAKLLLGLPPLFNSLNWQIALFGREDKDGNVTALSTDPSVKGKLESAFSLLNELAHIKETGASSNDHALVYSALGVLYRYYWFNAKEAERHEAEAIKLGGAAWFRVRFNDSRNANGIPHWLLIKSDSIMLERLIDNHQREKFMDRSKVDLNLGRGEVRLSRTGEDFILEVPFSKKKYYISPMNKAESEAVIVKSMIEKLIRK